VALRRLRQRLQHGRLRAAGDVDMALRCVVVAALGCCVESFLNLNHAACCPVSACAFSMAGRGPQVTLTWRCVAWLLRRLGVRSRPLLDFKELYAVRFLCLSSGTTTTNTTTTPTITTTSTTVTPTTPLILLLLLLLQQQQQHLSLSLFQQC
jgi:hypothetical protein